MTRPVKAFLITAALGLAVLASPRIWNAMFGSDYGSYFRIKVALTYKQQPVGFDIVVGCNVRVGHVPGGGSSVDTMGMTAFVFAKAIPDGHAISIQTKPISGRPDPCLGDTSVNGEVKPDWLPVIVWYERAEDLSHGYAYAQREAYDSPASQLVIGATVVERATAADYRRFLASEPPNLLPPHLADWMSHLDAPRIKSVTDVTAEMKARPTIAWRQSGKLICRGMRRWRMPPELAERVRQHWPTDQPRFWSPDREFGLDILTLMEGRLRSNRARAAGRNAPGPEPDLDPILIPSMSKVSLPHLTPSSFDDSFFDENTPVDHVGGLFGFLFCDRPVPEILFDAITGRKTSEYRRDWICRINNQIVAVDDRCRSGRYVAFERLEYIYSPIQPLVD